MESTINSLNINYPTAPIHSSMSSERRKFTTAQKMDILRQANEQGVTKVLKELRISYSVFSRWKQKLVNTQIENNNSLLQHELKELIEENNRLKKIIANQALDLDIKNEQMQKLEALRLKK